MHGDDDDAVPSSSGDGRTLEIQNDPIAGPYALEIGSEGRCHVLTLDAGVPIVLGSGFRADVRIEDRTVSARHVRIEATPAGVTVEDLGSKNGVWVAGARVSGARLSGNATNFVLGRTAVTVRSLSSEKGPPDRFEPIPGIVGGSIPMRRLAAELRRAAPLRAPVLLHGESGAGKDLAARALHQLSGRTGSLVPLNVATIPSSLADAELFGHRRGAFTGAVSARAGAFEEAHQGTLFLDEVADLDPAIQAKLLRVVEDQLVRPVGGGKPLEVDVRIVSATWASLPERVASGLFREDLYHRISTFVIRVPPLRTRKSDIPPLARALLRRIRDEVGEKTLGSAGLARLVAHGWPGNVRELSSVLYRAAVAATSEHIEAGDVEAALTLPAKTRVRALDGAEATALLEEHGGNVSAASRAAGVPRSTFRSWLER